MAQESSVLGLETIRRNRGLSLEQIADATKISIRSLRAIESGEFKKLPGGIYTTSYLKQYARSIDFDEHVLLAFYQKTVGAATPSESSEPGNGNGSFGGFRPASRPIA